MGKIFDALDAELVSFIESQKLFFVATAPLDADGLVNLSPKGLDTFRILGPREVAYLDLTGSGIETVAHSRENGRIVFMFCAFEGPPKIVRLHGTSEVFFLGSAQYDLLSPLFPACPGGRAIVRVRLARISDSCGYAVPQYRFTGQRDTLVRWSESKGQDGLTEYRRAKNRRSLDGLPGIEAQGAIDVD